jgi:hypothetical protein
VTDDDLIIHVLVIKGFCSEEAAAEATGLDAETVRVALARFDAAGLVRYRDGRICGWSPLPAGRDRHQALLAGPLAVPDPAAALALYQRFGEINADLKQVCTDWQMRPASDGTLVPNDHCDASYDAGVVARLAEVHAAASGVCNELEATLPRVARYRSRLDDALAAVRAGERDRFTRPLCGSYHDVWMELHQDLVLTLGITRTEADA